MKNGPKESSKIISPEEKMALEQKRRNIIALFAAIGITGGTATLIYYSSQKKDSGNNLAAPSAPSSSVISTASTFSPNTGKEKFSEQNERIEAIEKTFEQFASEIAKKAPKYTPKAFAGKLRIPLEVMQGNAGNTIKNMAQFKASKTGEFLTVPYQSPGFFSYEFGTLPPGIGASFHDPARTLTLSNNFDANETMDQFFLYHELFHVKDDEERRLKLKNRELPGYPDTLMLMLSGRPVLFIDDEVRTNALTLMGMNAYFDGKLANLGERATEKDIEELLGHPDNNLKKEFITMIKAQTNTLYNSGQTEEVRLKAFWQLVATVSVRSGRELYNIDPKGHPYPLEVNKK